MIGALVAGITGAASLPTSYDSIATANSAAGGSSFLEFTSIPSSYSHLQLRGIWLNSVSGTTLLIQFNADSGSNYKNHYLYGSGSSASAGVGGSTSSVQIGYKNSNTNTYPDAIITDILDYTNTNKYTTARTLDGSDENGSGHVELQSGLWLNTAAITSIKILPASGTISQYSTFALYGIKAA
jgi:hypothetical protein